MRRKFVGRGGREENRTAGQVDPRILIIAAVVIVVLVIGSVAAYFFLFRKTGPSEEELARQAAQVDSDNDGYPDLDEQAAGTDPNDPTRYPGSHKKVLVARTDIPANTLLKDDLILIKEVPAVGAAPEAAILESEKDRVLGHISAVDIKQNDFILDAMIYTGRPQLSYLVPKYKRAVSIRYDELSAVTGLIELGDLVDIIGRFSINRREGGTMDYAKTIIQNARVVAIGQMFMPPEPNDTTAAELPPPSGVTLAVYPHEAERLVWAENYGGATLHMALRAPVNDVLARTPGTTEESVFNRTLLNEARTVEVYVGGVHSAVVRFEPDGAQRRGLPRIDGVVPSYENQTTLDDEDKGWAAGAEIPRPSYDTTLRVTSSPEPKKRTPGLFDLFFGGNR